MHYTLLSEVFPPRHGGSGRWLYEIYRRQDTEKITAIVDEIPPNLRTYQQIPSEPWINRIPFSLQETGAFSLRGFTNYRNVLNKIRPLLRLSPDTTGSCIHAARVLPEGWLAYLLHRKTGVPFLCYAHGEEINLDGCENSGVMSSRQHRWMAKLVFRSAKKIIANSLNTERVLLDQWSLPQSKVVVMNPGVDASYFSPSSPASSHNQSDHDSKGPTLLTVGRLQKRKGQDQVIKALPLIRSKYPNIRYVIAGDGKERANLQQLTQTCGVEQNVIWKPGCTDSELLRLYQQCDLFLLANRQIGSDVEGFGMVLLEAAACEKATVTCDSGGTKEAVAHNVTGIVLEDSQKERIAACVIDLLDEPSRRSQLGTAGRKRVLEHYDWKVLASQFPKAANLAR